MPQRDKRQKASDVFAQTDFFMGGKTSDFSKAFPKIDKLKIEVIEDGEGINEYNREKHFTESNPPSEYIDCHNSRCYNGGVHIGQLLRYMTETNQTELESRKYCQGYEGSPKGKIKYDECETTFNIKISIVFKSQ